MSNNIIVIYTKDNCHYCTEAKKLIQSRGETYNETVIGRDITREEFIEIFPHVKTLPLIIINGDQIGGFDNLKEWHVSSRRSYLAE